jgi:hypothetical protein
VVPHRDLNDAKHWRDRAAELRSIADGYSDKSAAATLYRLADDYDEMATRAEDRIKGNRQFPQ